MNKNFILSLMIAFVIGLSFVSCCGDDLPPASVGQGCRIFEDLEFEHEIKGMNASLRNDEISSKILDTTKSMLGGEVFFYFHDGDFANENNWYSICTGLILTILSALFANKILR